MLRLIVLRARMRGWEEVLLAERLTAVLALERQEVDEVAGIEMTLLSDGEQLLVAVDGLGGHVVGGQHGGGRRQEAKECVRQAFGGAYIGLGRLRVRWHCIRVELGKVQESARMPR